MLNQQPSTSYGTLLHEFGSFDKIKKNKNEYSKKFALKCIVFTGLAILGFILMLAFSTNSIDSKAATDAVSHLELRGQMGDEKLAKASSASSQDKLLYRVSMHICDSVGAGGEEIDREYSPNYYIMIHTGEGVSSPLLIDEELERDGYIGQQYELFGLGRDIQYVTVTAMNNEPICIDSVTASVDPFITDGRGSIEKAWITMKHKFTLTNGCANDETIDSVFRYNRFLYFVGLYIDDIWGKGRTSSTAKLSLQLTGSNGKKSEVFEMDREELEKDAYYVQSYDSDINLGSKIASVSIFFPDDEDVDAVHINHIVAASAANPAAVTMSPYTDYWFHNDCDSILNDDADVEADNCAQIQSFDTACYGSDDDELDEDDTTDLKRIIKEDMKNRKGLQYKQNKPMEGEPQADYRLNRKGLKFKQTEQEKLAAGNGAPIMNKPKPVDNDDGSGGINADMVYGPNRKGYDYQQAQQEEDIEAEEIQYRLNRKGKEFMQNQQELEADEELDGYKYNQKGKEFMQNQQEADIEADAVNRKGFAFSQNEELEADDEEGYRLNRKGKQFMQNQQDEENDDEPQVPKPKPDPIPVDNGDNGIIDADMVYGPNRKGFDYQQAQQQEDIEADDIQYRLNRKGKEFMQNQQEELEADEELDGYRINRKGKEFMQNQQEEANIEADAVNRKGFAFSQNEDAVVDDEELDGYKYNQKGKEFMQNQEEQFEADDIEYRLNRKGKAFMQNQEDEAIIEADAVNKKGFAFSQNEGAAIDEELEADDGYKFNKKGKQFMQNQQDDEDVDDKPDVPPKPKPVVPQPKPEPIGGDDDTTPGVPGVVDPDMIYGPNRKGFAFSQSENAVANDDELDGYKYNQKGREFGKNLGAEDDGNSIIEANMKYGPNRKGYDYQQAQQAQELEAEDIQYRLNRKGKEFMQNQQELEADEELDGYKYNQKGKEFMQNQQEDAIIDTDIVNKKGLKYKQNKNAADETLDLPQDDEIIEAYVNLKAIKYKQNQDAEEQVDEEDVDETGDGYKFNKKGKTFMENGQEDDTVEDKPDVPPKPEPKQPEGLGDDDNKPGMPGNLPQDDDEDVPEIIPDMVYGPNRKGFDYQQAQQQDEEIEAEDIQYRLNRKGKEFMQNQVEELEADEELDGYKYNQKGKEFMQNQEEANIEADAVNRKGFAFSQNEDAVVDDEEVDGYKYNQKGKEFMQNQEEQLEAEDIQYRLNRKGKEFMQNQEDEAIIEADAVNRKGLEFSQNEGAAEELEVDDVEYRLNRKGKEFMQNQEELEADEELDGYKYNQKGKEFMQNQQDEANIEADAVNRKGFAFSQNEGAADELETDDDGYKFNKKGKQFMQNQQEDDGIINAEMVYGPNRKGYDYQQAQQAEDIEAEDIQYRLNRKGKEFMQNQQEVEADEELDGYKYNQKGKEFMQNQEEANIEADAVHRKALEFSQNEGAVADDDELDGYKYNQKGKEFMQNQQEEANIEADAVNRKGLEFQQNQEANDDN